MESPEPTEFAWLADLQKSQSFTTCLADHPAKTTDFGDDGYTASLGDYHDLLQVTAPDDYCGIVYVRGHFQNTPDAILARAQRSDNSGLKGSFGVRIHCDSHFELGEKQAQGLINFRWPYIQYELKKKTGFQDGNSGTYEEISFVKDGTVFQIARIKWGRGSSLSDFDSTNISERDTIKMKSGGEIQFGCPCSNGGPPIVDSLHVNFADHQLTCVSELYQKRLDIQMFVDNLPQELGQIQPTPRASQQAEIPDLSSTHDVNLYIGKPTIIVSTYAIRGAATISKAIISELDGTYFEDIENYLGISATSLNMTDRLWTALCSTNYESSEAVEFCVVGRCVEQILCVSSVPVPDHPRDTAFTPNPTSSTIGETASMKAEEDVRNEVPIALVRNIITSQYVDVQSSFWQVRLLVKIHEFIRTRYFEPDLLDKICPLDEMRVVYLTKLRRYIRAVLIWLIETDLRPRQLLLPLKIGRGPEVAEYHVSSARIQHCWEQRESVNVDRSYNQACFASLAVWYVMKYCPQAVTEDLKSDILLPQLKKAYTSVEKRRTRGQEDPTPKNDVLQWFHLCCLLLILREPVGSNPDGYAAAGLDADAMIKSQQKFQKYVTRLKTKQNEPYSSEDEEMDRLVLLGEELELQTLQTPYTASLATARAKQTRARLAERKRTTRFNPGPKAGKTSRTTSTGPWELSFLNHHSYLCIAEGENVRPSRDRCFEFVLSDYTFMTSWDHADSCMVGTWWDLEPLSVFSATILDLKIEGKLKSAKSEAVVEELAKSVADIPTGFAEQQPVPREKVEEAFIRDIISRMKQALAVPGDRDLDTRSKSFDWMSCQPGQAFHPRYQVQSIENTTRAIQTKYIPLRKELYEYLEDRGENDRDEDGHITAPHWNLENIEGEIVPDDLRYFSAFDLSLNTQFEFVLTPITLHEFVDSLTPDDHRATGSRVGTNMEELARRFRPPKSYTSGQLKQYQNKLFSVLNKRLVDLGARHRILFTQKCCPSIVKGFVYLWHPDAIDTFDDYFGATSRFQERRETVWTTTITISHWYVTSNDERDTPQFKEARKDGDFPPAGIAALGGSTPSKGKVKEKTPTYIMEERSSSLVITGDPSGNFWICSIWSSLTEHDSVSALIRSLPQVLQRFINQQACGRCLVFLILLGHVSENLAREYDTILERLDGIVELGDSVLLQGLDWRSSKAVDKLKKMLWGLEALRVFDDRLSASLSQIQKAREAMERTIKQGSGEIHVDLLQEYVNILEEFEKRYGMLFEVQIRTQLKIRQVTGLRDGISAVTNVEDNRTTIKQGNNIRILTWITIAYLPPGFVTGLFSISHGSFMDNATSALYAVLIVIFAVGTYGLALSLETIIERWIDFRNGEWQPSRRPPAHVGDVELPLLRVRNPLTSRRPYKADEEGSSAG